MENKCWRCLDRPFIAHFFQLHCSSWLQIPCSVCFVCSPLLICLCVLVMSAHLRDIRQVILQRVGVLICSPSFSEWKSKWAQVVIKVMNDFALPFHQRNMFSDPHPPHLFLSPFHPFTFCWMWVACSGLFVFGKEIPCLCGGGCPWVFVFFNHIFFDLLLPLLPPVCRSVCECGHAVLFLKKGTLCCFCVHKRAFHASCTYISADWCQFCI